MNKRAEHLFAQSVSLPNRLMSMARGRIGNRTKSKTMSNASNIFLSLTLAVVVGAWALGPLVFQRQALADGRVAIHGQDGLDFQQAAIEAGELLGQSAFRTTTPARVVVVPRWYLVLINPVAGWNSQGMSALGFNLIYINRDAEREGSARTLGGNVAHEVTHIDLYERYGWRAFSLFLALSWKVEGLCDYVSKQSSVSAENQEAVIAKYRRGESLPMREKYLIYKLQIRDVIERQKIAPDQVLTADLPIPTI